MGVSNSRGLKPHPIHRWIRPCMQLTEFIGFSFFSQQLRSDIWHTNNANWNAYSENEISKLSQNSEVTGDRI
jgi:hypothetical protein